MLSPHLLPVTLLAFLGASSARAAPTSRNDPFRAIALHVPRRLDPPICCLKPLTSPEPVEEEVFLSFEEWKAKQSIIQEQAKAKEKDMLNRSSNGGRGSGAFENGSVAVVLTSDVATTVDSLKFDETLVSETNEAIPPHFRVPLTDRFNYASLDCSARVHASHRSAKSTSSILSSKRDRYMLSPCNSPKGEPQFVVVELCEDIRIDTVQLANFEFFSGVFKDFSVSVAKTYTTKVDEWTLAGTYRAKNVRGVQSFHPPTSLRDFYRYIRIDFLSHYSNEFYCPISLLRVYGLTHLEKWKWDLWEEQSRAKRDELLKITASPLPSQTSETAVDAPGSTQTTAAANETSSETFPESSTSSDPPSVRRASTDPAIEPSVGYNNPNIAHAPTPSPTSSTIPTSRTSMVERTITTLSLGDTQGLSSTTNSMHSSQDPSSLSSQLPSPIQDMNISPSLYPTTTPPSADPAVLNSAIPSSRLNFSTSSTPPISAHPTIAVTTVVTPNPPPTPLTSQVTIPTPVTTGGESIYRTIMNRLTALEANHTLYTQYVEQQTKGVQDVLKRLGEDIGRLEGISRAQAVMLQRSLKEWEMRQQRLQLDYGELMARVEYLSDEIVLEKRLGIAQLCLLLAVLVFMSLTRGSRGEPVIQQGPAKFNNSMREWGRRHLTFSGEWTTRFKNRTQSPPKPHPDSVRPLPIIPKDEVIDAKVAFPSKEPWKREPLEDSHNFNIFHTPFDFHSPSRPESHIRYDSRSRTPSLRTRHHQHPITPTLSALRPHIQRSNSHGGTRHGISGPASAAPRSARRWAKSAHLHEFRSDDLTRPRRRGGGDRGKEDRENGVEDVFYVPSTAPSTVPRYSRREGVDNTNSSRAHGVGLHSTETKPGNGEGDPWVDTDYSVDDSEPDFSMM